VTRVERALLVATAKAVSGMLKYLWDRRESPAMSTVNHWRRGIEDALEDMGERP
jgi:hypothetical protein